MRQAFVDTGGFYALISENDVEHERAVDVFRQANAERWKLVTTNVVVFETYALLLHRTGEGRPKAIQFLDHLKPSGMRVERVTREDEDKAIVLVRAHTDKTYSLCDALGFVVCERLGIDEAIACDADFARAVASRCSCNTGAARRGERAHGSDQVIPQEPPSKSTANPVCL